MAIVMSVVVLFLGSFGPVNTNDSVVKDSTSWGNYTVTGCGGVLADQC